jgi:3-oxoacid CoA-transferase
VPQGTLAEKCRSAGAGIPAFYTATGVGTLVQKGGIPIKFKPGGKEIELESSPKEVKTFNGRQYVLEESLFGDYAFIKALKADTKGNLVYNKVSLKFVFRLLETSTRTWYLLPNA